MFVFSPSLAAEFDGGFSLSPFCLAGVGLVLWVEGLLLTSLCLECFDGDCEGTNLLAAKSMSHSITFGVLLDFTSPSFQHGLLLPFLCVLPGPPHQNLGRFPG